MQVHFSESPTADHLAILERGLSGSVELSFGPEPNAVARVLVTGRPRPEELDAMTGLESLIIPFAGVPEATRERMLDRPEVMVYNLHHNAAATAEMALALMMSVVRRIPVLDKGLRQGDWSGRTMPDAEGMRATTLGFDGARALVVGYGEIGRRVAQVCLALGMQVDAIKRVARSAFDGDVSLYAPSGLLSVLPKADVVLLTLPLTPETTGLLGFEELGRMKPGSILINVSRGAIVDEEALFRALESGHLGGAGLDVWWQYPSRGQDKGAPSQFDFASLDSVVMTPHLGGSNRDTERRRMEALRDLMNELAVGKKPKGVDLAAGY